MPGETDVINAAARLVGAEPITSLIDGTKTANVANDIYDELRDHLLRCHPWDFAIKRVQLAQSSTEPAFEFDHAYPVPADWLRTISVHDNDAGHGTILYRMEQIADQRAIVTSSDQVYLRYVARVEDPNMMTSDFRRLLEVSLARDFAIPLAASNAMQEQYQQQAIRVMAQARSTDALGSFPELRPRGSWASSRGGSRRNQFFSDD